MTDTLAPEFHAELTALFNADPAVLSDPYPLYAKLRDQPVLHWNGIAVVSRHADVLRVLRDPDVFSARRHLGSRVANRRAELDAEGQARLQEVVDHEALWLTQNDDPEHKRLRGLANLAFTRRRVADMRGMIEDLVEELLGAARERGTMEFVQEASFPLPLLVISAMLGAPKEDAELIRGWSDEIALAIGTTYANLDRAYEAVESFRHYVAALIDSRRGEPGTDLFTVLVNAEQDGERLSRDELVAMFVLLLFAGHETTTNLMSNAVVALIRNPDQQQRLRDNPALIAGATEEFLRYCNSVHAIHRVALADTEIGGVPVSAGTTVRIMLTAANHDPAVFSDPETMDITRQDVNKQVGLGFGIHTCLGAWLLRLETEVLVKAMLEFPVLDLDHETVPRPNFLLAGPQAVQLRLR